MQIPLCLQQTTLLHISNNKLAGFLHLRWYFPRVSCSQTHRFFVSQRAQEIHTRYHPTYWNGNATVPRNRLSFSSSRLVLREYPSSTSTNLRRCFLHNRMQVPLKILNACFNTNEAQPYTQGDTLNSFVSSCPLHLHGLGTVLGCITEVFLTWLSLPRVELTVIFNYHTFYGFTAVGFTTVDVEFFEFGILDLLALV